MQMVMLWILKDYLIKLSVFSDQNSFKEFLKKIFHQHHMKYFYLEE